jgi:hypothetical protein
MNGSHGPVFSPKSKLLQRRNPLAKKTAVKKVVLQKPARFIRDFDDAQKILKELELDLGELRKKLNALCHDPHIIGPKQPSPKK